MSNSDTGAYELSQHAQWMLLAGIDSYIDWMHMECQCDTVLLEIDRAEAWDREHGGYYDPDMYAALRTRVRLVRAEIRRNDMWWYNTSACDQ